RSRPPAGWRSPAIPSVGSRKPGTTEPLAEKMGERGRRARPLFFHLKTLAVLTASVATSIPHRNDAEAGERIGSNHIPGQYRRRGRSGAVHRHEIEAPYRLVLGKGDGETVAHHFVSVRLCSADQGVEVRRPACAEGQRDIERRATRQLETMQ